MEKIAQPSPGAEEGEPMRRNRPNRRILRIPPAPPEPREQQPPAPPSPEEEQFQQRRLIEEQVKKCISSGYFAVALSGGGHRATLAAIGTLLALVDRGLNRKVLQIASISGGSIANAYVAQRCDYDKLDPGQFDELAGDLANKVVEKGVLTWPWFLSAASICLGIVVGVTHVLLSLGFGTFGAIISVLLGLLAGAGLLIGDGKLVDWLMSSLSVRGVDHVFGMTDLVLGLPFFVSNQGGGTACRWLGLPEKEEFVPIKAPLMHLFGAAYWSVAEVVRASAGFPGIAPLRVHAPDEPSVKSPLAFLADGGIWNNLGTQVLREGRFFGGYLISDHGNPRLIWEAPYIPILVMNGSLSHCPTNPLRFHFPGFALFAAVKRAMLVMNSNTVFPRVIEMQRSFHRRLTQSRRPDKNDPLDLIVDLSNPGDTLNVYARYWLEESIRDTDEAVKRWGEDIVFDVSHGADHPEFPAKFQEYMRTHPKPIGSFPAIGLLDKTSWDDAFRGNKWNDVMERETKREVHVSTTLGRIDPSAARSIIARAYLNTFIASLYLAPLGDDDLDWVAALPTRLDRIVRASADASRRPARILPR